MTPRAVWIALALAGLALAVVALRFVQHSLDPRSQSFTVTPTLAEARERGTLLAEYRAEPLVDDAPSVRAVYGDRPTKLVLGPLLRRRPVEAEAVRVTVRLGDDVDRMGLHLVFDDGAGVRLRADGSAEAGPFDDGTTDASDRVTCCFAFRSRLPDTVWLERDGRRLVAFHRLP